MTDDLEMIYENAKRVFNELAELRLLAAKMCEPPLTVGKNGMHARLQAVTSPSTAHRMTVTALNAREALTDLLARASTEVETLRDVADDAIQEIGVNRLV